MYVSLWQPTFNIHCDAVLLNTIVTGHPAGVPLAVDSAIDSVEDETQRLLGWATDNVHVVIQPLYGVDGQVGGTDERFPRSNWEGLLIASDLKTWYKEMGE